MDGVKPNLEIEKSLQIDIEIQEAVKILNDGWTVVTQDGSLSAHFEHTVLITESEPEILTCPEKMPSRLKVS